MDQDLIDKLFAVKGQEQPTLRDQFAMAALTGKMAEQFYGSIDIPDLAEYAYEMADAMLKERAKVRE